MTEFPLVTVNILSFNRKDELRNTLTKVYEQDYKNIEVIVVDNASSDGSPEMVKEEFPDVILIKLDKNIGIAGWNRGFEVAKGEYILVLDDDSYPEKYTLNLGITYTCKKKIDILALNVFNCYLNKFELEEDSYSCNHFIGCGVILSQSIISNLGGFSEILFIYCHEFDYVVRAIENNYKIDFLSKAIILHRNTLKQNNIHPIKNPNYFFYSSRNNFFLTFYYIPFPKVLLTVLKYIINRIIVAFVYGYKILLVKAFIESLKIYYHKRRTAIRLSRDTLEKIDFRIMPYIDREYFEEIKKINKFGKLKELLKLIVNAKILRHGT
jgi:GT2 family glycosyltransferase